MSFERNCPGRTQMREQDALVPSKPCRFGRWHARWSSILMIGWEAPFLPICKACSARCDPSGLTAATRGLRHACTGRGVARIMLRHRTCQTLRVAFFN